MSPYLLFLSTILPVKLGNVKTKTFGTSENTIFPTINWDEKCTRSIHLVERRKKVNKSDFISQPTFTNPLLNKISECCQAKSLISTPFNCLGLSQSLSQVTFCPQFLLQFFKDMQSISQTSTSKALTLKLQKTLVASASELNGPHRIENKTLSSYSES